MPTIPVLPPACANWVLDAPLCTSGGTVQCTGCRLVLYCGPGCQKAHWPVHKRWCKSPLSKLKWRPNWDLEGRPPAWASGEAATNAHNPFGATKYLWGNVPAIDTLQLRNNESFQHSKDISLLFAASGDLRNVVKTITSLPDSFSDHVQITVNDREFDVVARNAILLLLAFTSLDADQSLPEIAESIIHVWYSAFITPDLVTSLQSKVKPLISAVCTKVANTSPTTLTTETWKFRSGSSLHLTLQKKQWLRLKRFMDVPGGLDVQEANELRAATMLAPERMDYRDRWYYKDATPSMRLAKQRFRVDGLLLPFGHPRWDFDTPNPTLFQTPDAWPTDDQAEPLAGWPIQDVNKTPFPATHDWYGKLFVYLRDELSKFLSRLATGKIDFKLYGLDVNDLPPHLEPNKYTRIEVSNITDSSYVGTAKTLRLLSPFLQPPEQNPHATLISLYLNATMEVANMSSQDISSDLRTLIPRLSRSPDLFSLVRSPQGADMYKIWDARTLVLARDQYFDRFMVMDLFGKVEAESKVEMKKVNTVVEKWPTALKLKAGEEGAQEEFDLLLASNFTGIERYVEWKRVQ